MKPEKLSYMANQIAAFFRSRPREDAVAGVAAHINSFWDPRMRAQLLNSAASAPSGLDPLVVDAMPQIRAGCEEKVRPNG